MCWLYLEVASLLLYAEEESADELGWYLTGTLAAHPAAGRLQRVQRRAEALTPDKTVWCHEIYRRSVFLNQTSGQ